MDEDDSTQHLPPAFAELAAREIWVPRYPEDPMREGGIDKYHVDVGRMVRIIDGWHEDQLKYVTAWWFTLSNWAWQTEIAAKAITSKLIDKHKARKAESTNHIKTYVLPTDHDWVRWHDQAEWLKNAVEAVGKLIPLLQTFNANRRAGMTPGFSV